MKARKHSGQLVAELRKIIGKSQTQFAAMVGVSKHTIISVENGRNELSHNLARRIQSATGANLWKYGRVSPCAWRVGTPPGPNYTAHHFKDWREHWHPSNDETARKQYDLLKNWLKVVFVAAAKSGVAGNRDRLPAVCLAFTDWLEETREKFTLDKEIESVLDDETRHLQRVGYDISCLPKEPKKLERILAHHGLDAAKIKKEIRKRPINDWLFIEDEFRRNWDFDGITEPEVCNPRKLTKGAKYYFVTPKDGWPGLRQIRKFCEPLADGSFPQELDPNQE